MAGLYIHIPFCKSRCLYCDFYSTTSLDMRQRYVDALCRELDLRGKSGLAEARPVSFRSNNCSSCFYIYIRCATFLLMPR